MQEVNWKEVLRASASFLLIYLVDHLLSDFLMGYPNSALSSGSSFSSPTVTLHYTGAKHGNVCLTSSRESTPISLVSKLTERVIHLETPLDKSNVWIGELWDRSSSSKTQSTRVAVKLVQRTDVTNLRNEYALYTGRLAHLQGTVVPRCYGFYEANGLAVLVLEYIHTTPYPDLGKDDAEEAHRLMMLGLCSVHEAGVTHGALFTNNPKRPHVLIQRNPGIIQRNHDTNQHNHDSTNGRYDDNNSRPTGVRFISFTKATDNHRCTLATPLLHENHQYRQDRKSVV